MLVKTTEIMLLWEAPTILLVKKWEYFIVPVYDFAGGAATS